MAGFGLGGGGEMTGGATSVWVSGITSSWLFFFDCLVAFFFVGGFCLS